MTGELPYRVERAVMIQARPETVFRYFTDSARWANWWGAGSAIDARPGGRVYIRHANGVEVLGEVLEVAVPERIVFTYGYASGNPIPAGASRVSIRLEPVERGTRVHLLHEFADAAPRDEHLQGWRFQLSLFSNVVANELYAGAAEAVDAWFGAWTVADDGSREEAFTRIATPEIRFRDRYSLLEGLPDLTAHTGAYLRFLPGVAWQRSGAVRHCQGTVLADWIAADTEGKPRMNGTSVFVFTPEGRIDSVTSFAA